MTIVGSGGVIIRSLTVSKLFKRDYRKLTEELQTRCDDKLKGLVQAPRPPGLRFEKLKGHRRPEIFTIHLDGNYKISFDIDGDVAYLRRVGPHNDIDRAP